MPQRSNAFQKLVFLIRKHTAPEAVVTESKMLVDRHTKGEREVDVCIESKIGGDSITISVECRDHERDQDVTWIDTMHAKHARLPTNKLILASSTGFSKEAQLAAAALNIDLVSLKELDKVDFPKLLGESAYIWAKSFEIGTDEVKATLRVGDKLALVSVQPATLLYLEDGSELCQFGAFVHRLITSEWAKDYLQKHGADDHTYFSLQWSDKTKFVYMQKIDSKVLHRVELIDISGRIKFITQRVKMQGGQFAQTIVAWAETTILGKGAMIVATKDDAGAEKLSVNLSYKVSDKETGLLQGKWGVFKIDASGAEPLK